MSWLGVLLLCAGCYAEKLAGMFLPPRWITGRPLLERAVDLLPTALLAGLVATSALLVGKHVHADGRLLGVAVAVVLLLRKAPLLVVIVAASAATALLRLLT
ncbi:MAG TPA: AzlD domain-containing protein [Mycobacteriales bacterium]|nr:AzlD domain-containing protein [Mycobacteriales bacterium]